MHWVDGTHLLFGEEKKAQVLQLPESKLASPTGAQRNAGRSASASTAREGAREKRPFDSEWGKIWFAGDNEPAGSVLDENGTKVNDMEISGDGKVGRLLRFKHQRRFPARWRSPAETPAPQRVDLRHQMAAGSGGREVVCYGGAPRDGLARNPHSASRVAASCE